MLVLFSLYKQRHWYTEVRCAWGLSSRWQWQKSTPGRLTPESRCFTCRLWDCRNKPQTPALPLIWWVVKSRGAGWIDLGNDVKGRRQQKPGPQAISDWQGPVGILADARNMEGPGRVWCCELQMSRGWIGRKQSSAREGCEEARCPPGRASLSQS